MAASVAARPGERLDRVRWMAAGILIVEDDRNIGNLVANTSSATGIASRGCGAARTGWWSWSGSVRTWWCWTSGCPASTASRSAGASVRRVETPVIMLTARDEEVDRVLGLELGADDYVPKPFSPRELVARVKAVLRRTQPRPPSDVLTLGDVELRRGAREATSSGAALDLTMKEFDLLACFLEHPGLALSREQLLEQVWGLEFPGGTRTVDQHVAQLRAKLDGALTIETLRGIGYKLVRP